ncbi:hypothetical protein C8Q75DRAFT_779538 [Abortiporus biennis]|nr:hypothetical protein C8Q75DRAFT_779538 [Abortiporus biennis]
MKELLTVLRSMTESLEVLELDESLPKLRVDKLAKSLPAPSGNVELRKLHSLHLGGVGYSPSYFLTHLTIPSFACLSMKYSVRGIYKPVNDQFLIPIIASRLLEDGLISNISPLLSLSFYSTPSDGMLIIRGWNDSVHSFEEAYTPAHTPKITITVPVKYQNFATSILSLTKSLPFPSTQILHLSVGQFYISPERVTVLSETKIRPETTKAVWNSVSSTIGDDWSLRRSLHLQPQTRPGVSMGWRFL